MSSHPRGKMIRDPVRLLPLAVGFAAALILLAVVSPSPDLITVVCNNGTTGADGAYERCLAGLPARQAAADESARVWPAMTGPIVAAAGGLLIGASAHLLSRRSRSVRSGDIPAT